MLTLITKVDKTSGNYEDIFLYTLNAGFSGIEKEINTAKIKIAVPTGMEIYVGDVEEPIKSVTEELTDTGKNVVFNFENLEDTGIAVRIGFGIKFTTQFLTGQTFELVSEMYINEEKQLENTNEAITLSVVPRFELERTKVLPTINPAPGGEIYFLTTVQNFGDLGGEVQNIEIIIEETEGLTIDQTYPVVGRDSSAGDFTDTSQDGILGEFVGNTIVFTVPNYKGEIYEFYYKAIIDSELGTGSKLVTNANWSVDSVEKTISVNTITLGKQEGTASISVYGPEFTVQDVNIGYEIDIANTGNQALESVTILEDLSDKVNYYRIRTGIIGYTGIDDILEAEYEIEYLTELGVTGTFGPFNTSVDSEQSLQQILDDGDNIDTLTWNIPSLGVGITHKTPIRIDGIVKTDEAYNSTIVNDLELAYTYEGISTTVDASKSSVIQDASVLQTEFSQTYLETPINPGTTIRYTIGANARMSRLSNPIIAFIMPTQLEYIGNETIEYSDYFEGELMPKLPPAVIVENINANGDSAVKFEFKDDYAFDFRQKSTFNISFDAQVKVGENDPFSTFMILNTFDTIESIPSTENTYKDTANIADDENVSDTYAKSIVYTNQILFFVSTKSKKLVKGSIDEDFVEEPLNGKTVEGGTVDYKLLVTNIGNAELQQLEIVDILPYVGDVGVVDIETSRQSEFQVYALSDVSAKIIKEDGTTETAALEVFYSQSVDPVRFGAAFTTIGTVEDWTVQPPEDLTTIRAIKVSTSEITISPNDVFEVDIACVAPVGVSENMIAWNSFAANVSYINTLGEVEEMVAFEPQKIGVEISGSTENTGKINGFTWFDTNKDGLPDDDELGINGVAALLVDEKGYVTNYVVSAPNSEEADGYYAISEIVYGTYTMMFAKDEEYSYTTQRLDEIIGSKANQTTGAVAEFDIDETNNEIQVNVGLIDKEPIEIKTLLEVNESANAMVKNVIRNQMLIGMKTEDTIELINKLES